MINFAENILLFEDIRSNMYRELHIHYFHKGKPLKY